MAFGTLGSTLNDELNRLANGGTYRDMDDMVDEALAAKQWANRENIVPYSTDTVGILNEIAALGPNRQNWFDFNGVCNYLAGTTGLPAAAALRQITTTGDILTSLAAFYTDAADALTGGYLFLPGITGNYASAPDSSALDITGDLDLRIYCAPDTWTPAADTSLINKYGYSDNNRSYSLGWHTIADYSKLTFRISTAGTTANFTATASENVPFLAGQAGWARVTYQRDTGSGQCEVKFYYSTNGTTWIQLGTAFTAASPAATFNSTAPLLIGAIGNTTTNVSPFPGKIYRAQVLSGINGTTAFDANFATGMTSQSVTSFTESSTNAATVSITRTTAAIQPNVLTNQGSAGSLLPVTVGSSLAADSNDAKFLAHDGTNYVYLPGGSTPNILTVPDSAALRVTGDIDLRAYIALDNYASGAVQVILSKWDSITTKSYGLYVNQTGLPGFYYSADGVTTLSNLSSAALTTPNGSPTWVRVTFASATGTIYYYTSTDGTNWTQLGGVQTGTATTINANASRIEIGSIYNGSVLAGKIYRAQVYNGIDGTKVLDVDTSVITSGADTYVVPTTYTGQAGAYFTGSGLSLNGVAGNYVSTPDSSALDITGDLDVQVKVAMTDWTPAASESILLSKTASDSYTLNLLSTGVLRFQWVTSAVATLFSDSTVATGITDGATKWVRVTLDVNNGASGNTTTFYTSDDGTNWTVLGSPVVKAGTTDIRATTGPLNIGAYGASGTLPAAGTFYRAIVKSGIDGYAVFDADFTQVPANALRMTESSINKAVVTLNTTRYATINRSTSGRKTVAVTQPTWLFGTDDYMEVNNRYMAHSTSDENYVYLSGNTGNSMTVADTPPLDITGDIDIQVKVALDDWTTPTQNTFVSKESPGDRAYALYSTGGYLFFSWSADGNTIIVNQSTVTYTPAAGTVSWVRATLDVNNGAGGNTGTFYTSSDGITWTQLGATSVRAGTTNIYSGANQVAIGSRANSASPAKGKFYRAIIKNGIDGTTVLDANAATITSPSQTTFTDSSSNAYTVTINKSGVGTFVSTGNYLYLPGVASNYASAPDAAALDITGDIDLRVKVAMDDWTPSAVTSLIAKWEADATRSWHLRLLTNGTLQFRWYNAAGTVFGPILSTVATGLADGATKWVRVTFDVDNGAGGNDVKFFLSDDGLTWTQLGSTVTTAGTTNIRNGTAALWVGADDTGAINPARGKFFRAQVLNGIGGTVAFDANFESSITSLLQTSFTESSSNAATVTINRSGSTYRSAGVIDAGYLYPGATNTFSNSTTDFLNFAANQSFTLFFVGRQWGTPASFGNYLNKKDNATNQGSGYRFGAYGTGLQTFGSIADGTNVNPDRFAAVYTAGTLINTYGIADRTAQTFMVTQNSNSSATASLAAFGAISSPFQFSIGRSSQGTGYQDFELIGVAVFRQALTAAQIRQITNYFANREAYL